MKIKPLIRDSKILLCLMCALFVHAVASAQLVAEEQIPGPKTETGSEPASDGNANRVVLLVCRFAPDCQFSPEQRQLFLESMVVRLGSASEQVVIREYSNLSLSLDTNLDTIASLSGIDAWLEARISGSMEKARIDFLAKDLQRNNGFFETSISAKIDTRFRNAFGGLWAGVGKLLSEKVHPVKISRKLRFEGSSGTSISLDDASAVVIPEAGFVEFDVKAPASHHYESWKAGFRHGSASVFVESNLTLALPEIPVIPFSAELGLEWLSFPFVRISWAVIPATLDIDLATTLYTVGIMPSYPGATNPSIFQDYHMIELFVGTRWYPLEHRYPFRPWFGVGAHLRILNDPITQVDPIHPAGWYFQAGFSVDLIPDLSVFVDLMPRFTVSQDPRLALESLALANRQNEGANFTAIMGPLLFEPFHFVLGLRFQPATLASPPPAATIPDQNSLMLQKALLEPILAQKEKDYENNKIFGWVGMGIGVLGTIVSVIAVVDGVAAYAIYSGNGSPSEIADARKRTEADSSLLQVSIFGGALGLISGSLLLLVDPAFPIRQKIESLDTLLRSAP